MLDVYSSKIGRSLFLACAIFLVIEVSLQIRAQIRYGQSIFNVATAESTYVNDPETGLKLLRAESLIEGTEAIIQTNRYGLRDNEILTPAPDGEIRIAVVGASTVMGAYTKNNADTLPSRLQHYLQRRLPEMKIRVINAGIPGYSLRQQAAMINRLLARLDVDYYVLYPGFTDISTYCRNAVEAVPEARQIPRLTLPKWLLSIELLTKNTVWLRTSRAPSSTTLDITQIDDARYREQAAQLMNTLAATHRSVMVVGNARSFRADMPLMEQERLSETARYYNPCFTTETLHQVYDTHNDILRQTAISAGLAFFNLQDTLLGGAENFGDATHFSTAGTDRAADLITERLMRIWFPVSTRGI